MDTSACMKEVDRLAPVAFSPDAPFLAAGTMAGAVDMPFSSSSHLEIFQLDLKSDDRKLPLVGGVASSKPFNRLCWGRSPSSGSEEFSLGLVAGGLVDGNIGIWNPRLLIGSEESKTAFVQSLSRHKRPVCGLEFSSLTPELLASGAEEGEICVWDIAKPAEATYFPPLKGSGSGEISFLSWNKKVKPILASTSLNGAITVWDLRTQKAVLSFSDSVKRRCSVLQWHPDIATEFIVSSDDNTSPALRLWDMRNSMSPLRELVGHTKGVVAMSWCPYDSSYLVTCAKDNRTICWDTTSAEIISEIPGGMNWNFDVQWYPKKPGVISASSFDGKIGIYHIKACESPLVSAPLRAPKRYKRKAGAVVGKNVVSEADFISKPPTSSGPFQENAPSMGSMFYPVNAMSSAQCGSWKHGLVAPSISEMVNAKSSFQVESWAPCPTAPSISEMVNAKSSFQVGLWMPGPVAPSISEMVNAKSSFQVGSWTPGPMAPSISEVRMGHMTPTPTAKGVQRTTLDLSNMPKPTPSHGSHLPGADLLTRQLMEIYYPFI